MRAFAETKFVDPIEEVDGKKTRRTMYENMQRSSALFQSKIAKSNDNKAAEKAQQQQTQKTNDDSLDFSSEFTNQDSGLSSGGQKSDVISNWEDILDDDDWLTEDEEEDEDEGSSEGSSGQEYDEDDGPAAEAPPEEWKPPPKKGGFFKSSFGAPASPPPAESPEAKSKPAEVEKKLGFEWGPVEGKKPVAKTPPKSPPSESANPDPVKQGGTVPLSATRRGGWQPSTPAIIPRARPLGNMLPARGQLERVEDGVVRAARLLIATPEDEPGYEECIRLLSRFGLGAIRICSKAKVKIHILDESGFTGFEELVEMGLDPEEFPVDGAYLARSKRCLIDRRCLTEKPRFFHPALYYFAHALDHAQGGDDFSSRKAAAVLACFEASASGYNGADFVDELAAADPVRYFARSVSIYLGRDDCDDPIWNHQDLFDFDRSMYDYLQYLFARFAV
jgi:hypothetical protein